MCGLVLLYGSKSINCLPQYLERLKHRGTDDQIFWSQGDFALGLALSAVGKKADLSRQLLEFSNLVGAFNCEIYNFRHLIESYDLVFSDCQTHVILQLFNVMGPRIIDHLDGFYSGIVHQIATEEVFCLRDHMGKKPLFVGSSEGRVFITSELKALDTIDWFNMLPRGCSRINLKTGEVTILATQTKKTVETELFELFERSVRKRMPLSNQSMGVFLSGGLDSSLVAAFASRFRDDITYFTLGSDDGPDRQAVDIVIEALDLQDVRFVPIPSVDRLPELLRAVVYATESYNPSIVSNGLATYLLAQAACQAGVKVVLTGEGADEFFGGYHHFKSDAPWKSTRDQLINDLQFTELRRLDLTCMSQGVEARCPFMDKDILAFSDSLSFSHLYEGKENKVTLRRSFEGVLPAKVLNRRKVSFDVGSGIRQNIVRYLRRNSRSEREELLDIWQQLFRHQHSHSYFHAYPVFDAIIDRRGEVHK